MHYCMNNCHVYRRSGNRLCNMAPANKVYSCTAIMTIKNRKANSNVLWPAVTQLHPRTRNTADRKTAQPLFTAATRSTAGFCLRHELFTAGELRCKSGAEEVTFDTRAHCCILRTHTLLAR